MKFMFAWELGFTPEILWCMGRLAKALKTIHPRCKITLACFASLDRAEAPWADEVFSAPRIAFQHEAKSFGVAQQLHQLGWTTDELRGMHMQSWSAAFEQIRPHVTFAFEAPGAVLVGTMLSNRVILATARLPDDLPLIAHDFPELSEWFVAFSGHPISAILNRPAISFLPSLLDKSRSSMVFNATLFDKVEPANRSLAAVFLGGSITRRSAEELLNRHAIEGFYFDDPGDVYDVERHPPEGVGLVIGSYDTVSTAYALNMGVPYMGCPTTDPESVRLAGILERQGRGYRIGNDELVSDLIFSGLDSFQARASDLFISDGGGACSVETACEIFADKKSPR